MRSLCVFKLIDHMKLMLHSEHLYGLSPVWTLMWQFRCEELLNALSHIWHLYGLSPVWTLMWLFRCEELLNALSHIWHLYGLSKFNTVVRPFVQVLNIGEHWSLHATISQVSRTTSTASTVHTATTCRRTQWCSCRHFCAFTPTMTTSPWYTVPVRDSRRRHGCAATMCWQLRTRYAVATIQWTSITTCRRWSTSSTTICRQGTSTQFPLPHKARLRTWWDRSYRSCTATATCCQRHAWLNVPTVATGSTFTACQWRLVSCRHWVQSGMGRAAVNPSERHQSSSLMTPHRSRRRVVQLRPRNQVTLIDIVTRVSDRTHSIC